jgi:hypothetical protein
MTRWALLISEDNDGKMKGESSVGENIYFEKENKAAGHVCRKSHRFSNCDIIRQ